MRDFIRPQGTKGLKEMVRSDREQIKRGGGESVYLCGSIDHHLVRTHGEREEG